MGRPTLDAVPRRRRAGPAAAPHEIEHAGPARRAAERDEEQIAAWREETRPEIKGPRRTWRLAGFRGRVRSGAEAAQLRHPYASVEPQAQDPSLPAMNTPPARWPPFSRWPPGSPPA